MKHLYLESRQAWRTWLRENHDKCDGIWLLLYKKNSGKPTIEYEAIVQEALCFGWIDSLIKKIDEQCFARKITPRKSKSKWSESNKRRIEQLINEGLLEESGRRKVKEAMELGFWDKPDRHDLILKISGPFKKALENNQKANLFFTNLAPSYQKQFLAWIEVAKRPDTMERRIRESIALLERGEKLGMK